jgi:hypothetical protein
VIKLTGWNRDIARRVDKLEDAPPPAHVCDQEPAIREHTGKVSALEMRAAGLDKWKWWAMGAALTVGLFAAGMAGRALYSQGEASTDRTGLRRDVDRHEGGIKAIREAQSRDRDQIIREVKAVPTKVQQSMPEPDIDDALDQQANGVEGHP